jgi:perosamine synthetase
MRSPTKSAKDFGRTANAINISDSISYNFKFTVLRARVGIEQLKKLDRRVERKRQPTPLPKHDGVMSVRMF